MIEYITGKIDSLQPTEVIIEAAGVGYQLYISLNTYTALQGKGEAKLFVYEVLREDAHTLFGFAVKSERELFTLLLSISGIGGQTARMLLSAFTPGELVNLILTEDVKMIKSVKGIGPKAAQRIVVELKDKVASLQSNDAGVTSPNAGTVVMSEAAKEAIGALGTLGFPPAAVQKTVQAIFKDDASASVEAIIKQALKML